MIQVSAARGSAGCRMPIPVGSVQPRGDAVQSRPPSCQDITALLQSSRDGRFVTSVSVLASAPTLSSLHSARRELARLTAADFELSADPREIAPDSPFEIVWAPVTAVVDLMLDWDLPELEITVSELAQWLDVDDVIAHRALDRLARIPGVAVDDLAGAEIAVRIRLDLEECPLTSAPRSAFWVVG